MALLDSFTGWLRNHGRRGGARGLSAPPCKRAPSPRDRDGTDGPVWPTNLFSPQRTNERRTLLLTQSSIPAGRQRSRRRRALYLRPAGNCKSCVRSGFREAMCVCPWIGSCSCMLWSPPVWLLAQMSSESDSLASRRSKKPKCTYAPSCCPPPPHCSFSFAVAVIRPSKLSVVFMCAAMFLRLNGVSLWCMWAADSKFTQQELPACKPMLTPGIVRTHARLLIWSKNSLLYPYICIALS
jgi:hypothetical protein